MCPADDSHLTLEFSDHYVIQPTIKFFYRSEGYDTNKLRESGQPVVQGFEYNSGTNHHFLSTAEIRDFNRRAKIT